MTARSGMLDVTIVLANEGYISTAIGPIEVFSAAGRMWDEMSGRSPHLRFRVSMASVDGAPVESAYGLRIAPDLSVGEVENADIVFVSASGGLPSDWMPRHRGLLPWLAEWHRRGAMIAGVCSGVAFLAEAGLLDGRPATTSSSECRGPNTRRMITLCSQMSDRFTTFVS